MLAFDDTERFPKKEMSPLIRMQWNDEKTKRRVRSFAYLHTGVRSRKKVPLLFRFVILCLFLGLRTEPLNVQVNMACVTICRWKFIIRAQPLIRVESRMREACICNWSAGGLEQANYPMHALHSSFVIFKIDEEIYQLHFRKWCPRFWERGVMLNCNI